MNPDDTAFSIAMDEVTQTLNNPLPAPYAASILFVIWRAGSLVGYDVTLYTATLFDQATTNLRAADPMYHNLSNDILFTLFSLALATLMELGYLETVDNNTMLVTPTQKLVNLLVDKMPV